MGPTKMKRMSKESGSDVAVAQLKGARPVRVRPLHAVANHMSPAEQRAGIWIVSRPQDLLWFQGSVIAGVLLLAAFLALPQLDQHNYNVLHPAVWLLLFWGVIFDGS